MTMKTQENRVISTPEAMIQLGYEMSQKATHILLYGDLGAGKTHFVKWFVEGLWTDAYKVQSPTYTYFHDYDNKILHMDMYRLEDQKYFVEKWFLQQISDFDYVVIEWPKFTDLYADWYVTIHIDKISETERAVTIE